MGSKRYGQWCGLAQALDRLGDRWTLLIVRELLLGPRRYSDLLNALGGIATNLLASRLQALEKEAIIVRREVPPPTPATVYELTERGQALEESVLALIRWGGRFLPSAPDDDEFHPEWLALALKATLAPKAARVPSATLAMVLPEGGIWVGVGEGRVTSGHGSPPDDAVEATGNLRLLLAVASGYLTPDEAGRRGLRLNGPEAQRAALAGLAAVSVSTPTA